MRNLLFTWLNHHGGANEESFQIILDLILTKTPELVTDVELTLNKLRKSTMNSDYQQPSLALESSHLSGHTFRFHLAVLDNLPLAVKDFKIQFVRPKHKINYRIYISVHQRYINCTCIADGAASGGRCSSNCDKLPVYLFSLFTVLFLTFLSDMPATTVLLKWVVCQMVLSFWKQPAVDVFLDSGCKLLGNVDTVVFLLPFARGIWADYSFLIKEDVTSSWKYVERELAYLISNFLSIVATKQSGIRANEFMVTKECKNKVLILFDITMVT